MFVWAANAIPIKNKKIITNSPIIIIPIRFLFKKIKLLTSKSVKNPNV